MKKKIIIEQIIANFASKIYEDANKAIADIKDGSVLCVGGFGISGTPHQIIEKIAKNDGPKNLTIVRLLLKTKQVKKIIASYVGENGVFEKQYLEGEIELELNPQGTLAERLRAAGAGIPAFFTPAGAGTVIEHGGLVTLYGKNATVIKKSQPKESRKFNGRDYVLETAIHGDFGLIKAWKADEDGNLIFRGTARNFNPECAKSSRVCIAQVEEIVPIGTFKPDQVHLPGIFVNRIVCVPNPEKRIERLTFRDPNAKSKALKPAQILRHKMAARAAQEFKDGMNVNLGIGIPTLCAEKIPDGMKIKLQSENGLLGMGPWPQKGLEDPDWINAGKETITPLPGASIFSSSESFAMIRGGHLDLTILGAMQVSETGDLANWMIPRVLVKGMGGAMDLISSGSRVIILTEHCDKKGRPKIVSKCSLPLTGRQVADMIISEIAVFKVEKGKGLTLIEHAKGVTVDEIKSKTGCSFKVSPNLKEMNV
ncbi:ketoacid-coenzyme a transferase [Anaeramoeba ignava]|uniref:Succinyl-CoA:3-ketoacid-coenzyme A transferase n=1 Tax=Anaeramoeba ignava TaxID=1746090 RepID=A0A9Q0R9X6_ANAIG|nr:ketoacid-coenzyme a transferase [Anaeramoeba ignava]